MVLLIMNEKSESAERHCRIFGREDDHGSLEGFSKVESERCCGGFGRSHSGIRCGRDAGALNQAVKAIAIARGFVAPHGIDLVCVPAFADIEIDGEERTAIKLIVEPR